MAAHEAIVDALSVALPRNIAAKRGGISVKELHRIWCDAFTDAETEGESYLLEKLRGADGRDAAKWMWQLERKYPTRYAERLRIAVSDEIAQIGEALRDGLTSVEYEKVRAILMGREAVVHAALPAASPTDL